MTGFGSISVLQDLCNTYIHLGVLNFLSLMRADMTQCFSSKDIYVLHTCHRAMLRN